MSLHSGLLILHIIAGTLSLGAGMGATAVKQWSWPHVWHKRFGLLFVAGMALVFVTAIGMSLLKGNTFLFFVALFSFYLAVSGWRNVLNYTGKPRTEDRVRIALGLLISLTMLGVALLTAIDNRIVLMVFSVIFLVNVSLELLRWRKGKMASNQRIALHLTQMLGGLIATITAVAVVNFKTDPAFIVWLAPTALITPYIVYWNRKLRRRS